MQNALKRYYMKKAYGGRSFPARAIDFLLFRSLIFVMIFIIVLYWSLSTTVSLLIAVFLTTAVSLASLIYNRRKIEKYIEKDMKRLKQKCMLEELTFMEECDYADYINTLMDGKISEIQFGEDSFSGSMGESLIYVLHNHPSVECGVQTALRIIRKFSGYKKLKILSLSEFSGEAKRMCATQEAEIELTDGKMILDLAEEHGMLPDEQTAQESAEKEMNEAAVNLEKLKKNALGKAKVKGYVLCGLAIMIWPFIAGFQIYYPILAVLCFSLAVISYKKSKSSGKESSGINAA